jgi:RsiW-degrading membrane proteinase PrsW (M82 family)
VTALLWQALFWSWMPGAFWLIYVESRAPHRSSRWRLGSAFVAGALSVSGVFAFHGATARLGWETGQPPQNPLLLLAYFCTAVGLLEEICKLLAVLLVCWPRSDFREPWDGLSCASAAALGFATAENFKYVLDFGDPSVLLGRFLLSTFAHVVMSGVWGYALGLAKQRSGGRWTLMEALGWSAVFHGFYDWFLTMGWALGALAVFIGLIVVFRQRLQESYFTSAGRQGSTQRVRECSQCRSLGRAEYAYCPQCGAQQWSEQVYCLSCLDNVSEASTRCGGCGREWM